MRWEYLTATRHVAIRAWMLTSWQDKMATSEAEMATSDGDLATSMATSH
jgi:hypothetical protein